MCLLLGSGSAALPLVFITFSRQYIQYSLISLPARRETIPTGLVLFLLRASDGLRYLQMKNYTKLFFLREIRLLQLMSLSPAALPGCSCATSSAASLPTLFLSFKKTTVSDAPTVLVDFGSVRCEEEAAGAGRGPAGMEFQAWPVFNGDRCHFTPCFMLPHDKARTPHNLPAFEALHRSRVEEIAEEREDLLVPRPSKLNSFCCVCRTFYEDYLEHLARPDHLHLLRQSKFCRDIDLLCARFCPPAGKLRVKGKPIRKENSRGCRRGQVKELMRSTSTEVSSLIFGDARS